MEQGQGCNPALKSGQKAELPHSSNVPPGEGTGAGLPTAQPIEGPGLQASTTEAKAGPVPRPELKWVSRTMGGGVGGGPRCGCLGQMGSKGVLRTLPGTKPPPCAGLPLLWQFGLCS